MAESVPGYRDLTRIGRGGFSVVYRAHQEAFDRQVALKILRIDSDDEVQRRFLREVKLTGRLTGHPNVVTILDAGSTDSGQPYLATGLYEGGSLRDRLRESGPLPAAEVASIGAKIADALHTAHGLGIVHRDVKPGNILISRFGEPALADFGVGCLLDAATSHSLMDSFSPHHVAPEVLSRSAPSPVSDVYSLGSTLYELLTGQPAFGGDGEEIAAVLWQIAHEPAPTANCPEIPGLAEVIRRAMSKEPGDRQTSAAVLGLELRALIPLESGVATHESAVASIGEEAEQSAARSVYISAFEPVAAAAAEPPPTSGDGDGNARSGFKLRPLYMRRPIYAPRRWPLAAGFAATVVVSIIVALLLSAPPKGSVSEPPGTDPASGSAFGGGSSAVSVGGGTTLPGSRSSTSGAVGALPPGTSPSAAGSAGATAVGTTPAPSAGTSAAVIPSIAPATSAAAATPTGCTGWTAGTNSGGSAVVKGNDKLRTGPYSSCTVLAQLKNKTQVTLWCYVVNANGETWVFAQATDAGTAGWTTEAMYNDITGTLSHC